MSDWIPISERLPEDDGEYLVSGKDRGEPGEVWICSFINFSEVDIGGWANHAIRPVVKAWMPLPKPYEEKKNNKYLKRKGKAKWVECEVFHNKEVKAHIDEWQSARCSECGLYHTTPYLYNFKDYKYCPNCGCKMIGDQE